MRSARPPVQPSRASLLAAAARRFTILLAGIAALTAIWISGQFRVQWQ